MLRSRQRDQHCEKHRSSFAFLKARKDRTVEVATQVRELAAQSFEAGTQAFQQRKEEVAIELDDSVETSEPTEVETLESAQPRQDMLTGEPTV